VSDYTIYQRPPAKMPRMDDSRPRCILVDDHPAVRAGLRSMFAAGDIAVVGETQTAEAAVEMAGRRLPDAVVMDVHLGRGMDGFAACAELTRQQPDLGVVLLTGFGEEGFAARALEAGALGYLLKSAPPDDMVRAVRAACAGEVYVDPAVAMELVAPDRRNGWGLTPRELEVLALLEGGLRSGEIAGRLFISRATVRSHVRNAMDKLHAGTFTQAVAEAIRLQLLPG
jgi:DNA-binding NarL/FixJ family response regulator